MAEKLALKKALFDELKETNREIENITNQRLEMNKSGIEESPHKYEMLISSSVYLKRHKDFIQRLIDICVDRNKF